MVVSYNNIIKYLLVLTTYNILNYMYDCIVELIFISILVYLISIIITIKLSKK